MVKGTWVEQRLEEIKKEIHTMTKEERETRALHIMEELFHSISGLKVENNK